MPERHHAEDDQPVCRGHPPQRIITPLTPTVKAQPITTVETTSSAPLSPPPSPLRTRGVAQQLTRTGGVQDADFSPDGKTIVFDHGDPNGTRDLYLMRSDGTGVRRLTNTPNRTEGKRPTPARPFRRSGRRTAASLPCHATGRGRPHGPRMTARHERGRQQPGGRQVRNQRQARDRPGRLARRLTAARHRAAISRSSGLGRAGC